MRTITPRWIVIGLVLLVWAAWSVAFAQEADNGPAGARDRAIVIAD